MIRRRLLTLIMGWAAGSIFSHQAISREATPGDRKSWTLSDNIAVQRLPSFVDMEWDAPFHYSQDGKYVAFVILTSDLANDQVTARLRVYATDELRDFAHGASLRPKLDISGSTRGNHPAIGLLRWSRFGNSLFFIDRKADRAVLKAWSPEKASPAMIAKLDGAIVDYRELDERRLLAFVPHPSLYERASRNDPAAPIIATGRTFPALLGWAFEGRRPLRPFLVDPTGAAPPRSYDAVVSLRDDLLTLSPDGHKLAFAEPMSVEWAGSCWRETVANPAPSDTDEVVRGRAQVAVLDLMTGEVRRPFMAPLGRLARPRSRVVSAVSWLDEQTLVSSHNLGAADRCNSGNGNGKSLGLYASVGNKPAELVHSWIEPDGAEHAPIEARQGAGQIDIAVSAAASFLDPPPSVINTFRISSAVKPWRIEHLPGWTATTGSTSNMAVLAVRQAPDIPPAITAQDIGGKERTLIELAPHARNRNLGSFKRFDWKDSAGRTWSAMLGLPSNYRAGQRLPLIVQTHENDLDKFFAEGASTSPFPGRAALGRGFAVLSIAENRQAMFADLANEAPTVVDAYQAALRALDKQGLIDPARVAIIGWSRTCYHLKYALTKMPDLFRVAVCADGSDFGYLQFLLFTDYDGNAPAQEFKDIYGATPWSDFTHWQSSAPGFNLDAVRAPILIASTSGMEWAAFEWEFYAGLRRLGKPAEMIVYPDGEHSLVRPSSRLDLTQTTLVWIDYWLNDRCPEDFDQTKCARWKRLARAD